MRLKPLLVPLVAATASLALLAGCTSTATPTETPTPTEPALETLSADEIVAASNEAMAAVSSFHLKGEIHAPSTPPIDYTYDMTYVGKDSKGTFTIAGVPVEVIKFGDNAYLKTNAIIWAAYIQNIELVPANVKAKAATYAAQLDGKWGLIGASLIGPYLPVPLTAADVFKSDAGDTFTKGDVTTLDGQRAIAIKVTSTDGTESTGYVALDGEPYLLKLDAGAQGGFVLSDFGAAATVEAPASPVDLVALFLAG